MDDKILAPNPRVAYRKIGGEIVIVHTLEETLVRLNPTATFIWGKLDGKLSVREIASGVEASFEVSAAEAIKDTREFMEMLLARGFVEER